MIKVEKMEKKKCFIITPIGSDMSETRRHIDGIINASIKPALGGEYKVTVAHEISLPGNITKQIIKEIYSSDLVIANLTDQNPNVMYELALRHCVGKPTIMICDDNTSLPSDIISERTIFYRNDAAGSLKLIEDLKDAVSEINELSSNEKCGPVYDVLADIVQEKTIVDINSLESNGDIEIFQLLLQRMDDIDSKISKVNQASAEAINDINMAYSSKGTTRIALRFREEVKDDLWIINQILPVITRRVRIKTIDKTNNEWVVIIKGRVNLKAQYLLKAEIMKVCSDNNYNIENISFEVSP